MGGTSQAGFLNLHLDPLMVQGGISGFSYRGGSTAHKERGLSEGPTSRGVKTRIQTQGLGFEGPYVPQTGLFRGPGFQPPSPYPRLRGLCLLGFLLYASLQPSGGVYPIFRGIRLLIFI